MASGRDHKGEAISASDLAIEATQISESTSTTTKAQPIPIPTPTGKRERRLAFSESDTSPAGNADTHAFSTSFGGRDNKEHDDLDDWRDDWADSKPTDCSPLTFRLLRAQFSVVPVRPATKTPTKASKKKRRASSVTTEQAEEFSLSPHAVTLEDKRSPIRKAVGELTDPESVRLLGAEKMKRGGGGSEGDVKL